MCTDTNLTINQIYSLVSDISNSLYNLNKNGQFTEFVVYDEMREMTNKLYDLIGNAILFKVVVDNPTKENA